MEDMEEMVAEPRSRALAGTSGNNGPIALVASEMSALEAFYEALGGGEQWQWRADESKEGVRWNFTKALTSTNGQQGAPQHYLHDPCAEMWQGVYCSCNYNNTRPVLEGYYYDNIHDVLDTSYCSVIKIALSKFGLSGSLPVAAFSAFTHLSHLHLAVNNIQGDFSSSLCSLSTNMTKLSVFNNVLTGKIISSCISRLTKLKLFILASNHFKGKEKNEETKENYE